jgi:hypothetical protein
MGWGRPARRLPTQDAICSLSDGPGQDEFSRSKTGSVFQQQCKFDLMDLSMAGKNLGPTCLSRPTQIVRYQLAGRLQSVRPFQSEKGMQIQL